MSSGGDEVNLPCWADDEETQTDLRRRNITIADALNEFVEGVQSIITAHRKTPFIKSGVIFRSDLRDPNSLTCHLDMVLTHNVPVVNDTVVV